MSKTENKAGKRPSTTTMPALAAANPSEAAPARTDDQSEAVPAETAPEAVVGELPAPGSPSMQDEAEVPEALQSQRAEEDSD